MKVKCFGINLCVFSLLLIFCQVVYAKTDTIIYETELYGPPFKFIEDGEISGFEIELNQYIFSGSEYRFDYRFNTWEKVYEKLKNGEIDTCGLLVVNEERKKDILFSDTVMNIYISIYSKEKNKNIGIKDLEKYRVGVGKEQYSEHILKDSVGISNYTTFVDVEEAIDALNEGKIDVIFENQDVVNHYLIKKGLTGKIIPHKTELFPVKVAYGVSKRNPELVKYINERLDSVKKNGIYEQLYRKHFLRPSDFYRRKQRIRNFAAMLALLVLLALLQVYIRHLKKKISKAYRELRKQHEWLRITLSSIGEAVITTDENGTVTFSNYEIQKMLGLSEEEILGKKLDKLLSGLVDKREKVYKIPIEEVVNRGSMIKLETDLSLVTPGGRRLVEGTVAPIRNDSDVIIGTVVALKDITEIKKKDEILYNMEYYDPLTGLPNRSLFSDRLKMALAQSKRNNEMCALIILDLDNFKAINDTLGHSVGDMLLKQVAEKIKGYLREVDTVARIGGDEFIIIQPQIKDINDATRAADRILKKFQQPWILEGKEYYITASMGIGIYPNDGEDPQTIFKNADTALYRAKELGRNNYQLYTESMNQKVLQRLDIENSLRRAIEKEEFVLFYQPQIDIKTGKIVGFEALLRWYHPDYGLMPPMEFIPVAEDSGLIVVIGEWVLETACRQNKKWIECGLEPHLISVNLSARQFQRSNIVEVIDRIRSSTGLAPELLELEITESTAMQDLSFTIDVLNQLRKKGIRVSLDDFGTGYSSLNYLRQLPIDTLKIDKSFVQDIRANSKEEAIAKTVISLAHKLDLTVVAEGVETKEQLLFLKKEKCDKAQGYLFSKPLPAEEIEKMLRDKKCFVIGEEVDN
ncbi:periplasmic sensor diguanylate cyclase/phosphodiesterase [Acetivibrio thermocellus AD2]|jgi:polar amino acid transport system substrate-binding protein|uniref:Periplasmic sensor diguanylate cyclase/phosphodiesterase n=1 Tax=Acetivibrio thermocellus AD2 TaxID=1138384 RepID=A0AB36TGS1_ACETH|nr:EAL domain-containing protein [Acetivibrio thermocellus]CDG35104.1 diguanylate cyclase/phosphodiesterase with PAS/PAC sensor(s) [Acetivibrio thermocellus BC1]ADU74869.1 diguanylate cyclase/phosphodiesterase with PAS/PAC sensor(s) [Acetivibrio thermocellus DSM 1313]ALX08824.1 diguanylate cyclase/phosphodiesterase with PAS/PAC and extracellular solute binding sensor [Acetivibrio thermocellus AD2]ANV76574.1 diguanylate cyclase/phosphodiesterase with PAS/PAC and extracellular solute binding sens